MGHRGMLEKWGGGEMGKYDIKKINTGEFRFYCIK